MAELHELTALALRKALLTGEVSPTAVTEHFLRRIAERDPSLGAFVQVTAEAARQRAESLEQGRPGAAQAGLWGMPSADKDLSDRAGVPTGFGSRAFADEYAYTPAVSDALVTQLDQAGIVSLGKTATPEFGLSPFTETQVLGATRNPWDLTRTSGGSSGGAAVAVAAGMLPVAPGSDGGGSIRIPAAACGLVGLKPTRGLLPAGGGVDALGGLTTAGPLARNTADAALLLEAMITRDAAGRAAYPLSLRFPAAAAGTYLSAALGGQTGRLRIGVSTFSPWEDPYEIVASPEALSALHAGVDTLAGLGHELEQAPRELEPSFTAIFRTLWMVGAATIPLDDPAQLARLEPLTQWLLSTGRTLGARHLADTLAALSRFERNTLEWIAPYDVIVLPGLGTVPPPLGWFDPQDGERSFEQQCQFTPYTAVANAAGLPALTVPIEWTAPTETAPLGLPMGIQLLGNPGSEATLLALAGQLEQVLDWTDRHPPLW
ncbi:MAG: amidase [Promicromonosporaceae bacterium]|nr:amidase [Promicromonosporaceae bacterium]